MKDTFVKIYRKLLRWRWADNPNMLALWVRILLEASYAEKDWHNITVKKGQLVTSVAKLSAESGLSNKQVRTCLEHLKETGEIILKGANKYSIITICNYDDYQSNLVESGQTNGEQNGEQEANKGQTKGKQRATSKEYKERKEEKEEEKINPPLSPQGEPSQKQKIDFEKIFEGYGTEWIELFKQWLDYKREKKNTYKGEKSIRAMAKKLFEMAGGDIITARAIVEQSMANNWQGLFELKTDGGAGGKTGRYKGDSTIGTNFIYRP